MSNFPTSQDDDVSIPPVNDNLTEVGDLVINALRSAVFAIEAEIGTSTSGSEASGTMGSIAARLGVSINPDGTIKNSALTIPPIYDANVAPTAAIQESKLALTYSTAYLKNLIDILDNSVSVFNNFLSTIGVEVAPHIAGIDYRHLLSHIDVDASPHLFKNAPIPSVPTSGSSVISRNIFNADTLIDDINTDLVSHEKLDGTAGVTSISGGTIAPENYAHMAGGVFIDTSHFAIIPTTTNDVQKFAEFVDDSSLLLFGTRTQTLFSNGISRSARSSSLLSDNGGQQIVQTTPAITYLLFSAANQPVDDIAHGDDVILFQPTSAVLSNNTFDAQFAMVAPGDIAVVDYRNGTVPVAFTIDSTKSTINGGNRTYAIRINGKNLFDTSHAGAVLANVSIYKTFYNENKYGVLALAPVHNQFNAQDTLIAAHPRSAATLGLGFNPDSIDNSHYNLYLAFYPDGNPLNKTIFLPPIDVTGNNGSTPGMYSLDSIKTSINNAFHATGYNYRFIAYSYKGEIGIMLADPYNNASFSVISGVLNASGQYDSNSLSSYPFNIVDNFNGIDPLGMGVTGSNSSSPPFSTSYSNPVVALAPTLIFSPMKRNFFYVDGVERERLDLEVSTSLDIFGDGYWPANIINVVSLGNRVETTYQIDFDLSTSGLKVGKTLVVQPTMATTSAAYNQNDYGRYIISDVVFNSCPGPSAVTLITVYDSVFSTGVSPASTSTNIPVLLYFNDDSVGFDQENVSDSSTGASFKRHFEILANTNGNIYSHERARFNLSGSNLIIDVPNSFTLYSSSELANTNIVSVSPKLRGYKFSVYTKIYLYITSYSVDTGIFNGYLCKFDGTTQSKFGPVISGKKGEVARFYDESNIDYIDIIFDFNEGIGSFVNKGIDIQLYPSLQLNQEKFFIGMCQTNDNTKSLDHISDKRQFGNISERHISDSAIDFINASDRLIRENGLIKGFDLVSGSPTNGISLMGGSAVINGKIVNINETTTIIPALQEVIYPAFTATLNTITWFVCLNEMGQIELVANTDFDPDVLGSTYGSLDHNRLFYVQNPNATSPSPYLVRSSWLFNIYTKFKDIVPIYMVTATVSLSGGKYTTTITSEDIRRYTSDGISGINTPLVLAPNGNFRTFDSVNNFLVQLVNLKSSQDNYFGNEVIVRSKFDINSTKTLDYKRMVKFVGQDGTFNITCSTGFNALNNVSFGNIGFINSYDATHDAGFIAGSLINYGTGMIYCQVPATGAKNITFDGCTFTTSVVNRFAFIVFTFNSDLAWAENIFIKNNTFDITIPTGGPSDDLSAVVAFIGPATSPTSTSSARLINCIIGKNICNKNSMIALTSSFNVGTNSVVNAIVPVNVEITNNICGSINFLMKRGKISTASNTVMINDKENQVLISGNNCKLIYTGLDNGSLITPTAVIAGITFNTNIFSCNAIVENNTSSWIQIGITIYISPTSNYPYPSLIVKNNQLFAYSSAFLNSFALYAPHVLNNTGLLIRRVADATFA